MHLAIFFFLSAVFFIIYFKILSLFSFPISPSSNIFQLFIIIIIIIPLSVYSASKLIELIKKYKCCDNWADKERHGKWREPEDAPLIC